MPSFFINPDVRALRGNGVHCAPCCKRFPRNVLRRGAQPSWRLAQPLPMQAPSGRALPRRAGRLRLTGTESLTGLNFCLRAVDFCALIFFFFTQRHGFSITGNLSHHCQPETLGGTGPWGALSGSPPVKGVPPKPERWCRRAGYRARAQRRTHSLRDSLARASPASAGSSKRQLGLRPRSRSQRSDMVAAAGGPPPCHHGPL